MSGTTSPLGFPYPTDTDLVTNGDEAIQSLAEAVDDYLAGANTTVTAGTNITMTNGKVYRRGGLVYLLVDDWATTGAIAAGDVIATIPAGYRPPVTIRAVIANFTDSVPVSVFIDTAGLVKTSNAIATTKTLKGGFTYPI